MKLVFCNLHAPSTVSFCSVDTKKCSLSMIFFLYHFELVVSLVYLVYRRELLGSNRVFLDLCDRSWKYGNGFVVDESNTAIIIVYRNGSRKVRRWMKIGYS